jgi:tRNA-dihydrouridine synthase B
MRLDQLIPTHRPLLILAPMQDVTDLSFWKVISQYGGPDLFYTEYFRTHADSKPEPHIIRSLLENDTGKPVIAQMIGQDISSLVRTAKILQKYKVIGIDLNLGCPAPIVCRKNAGGGMLRNPHEIDLALGALRDAIEIDFTVKTRVGYDLPEEFDYLLKIFGKHSINALTVHGRTVKEMYRSEVHYDRITQAVTSLKCPVFANGNILRVGIARATHELTGAAGLMIGRGAIRNPWIFKQIMELFDYGMIKTHPSLSDVRTYIERLFNAIRLPSTPDCLQVAKMKKFMSFIVVDIGENNIFLDRIKRCSSSIEFFKICDEFLLSEERFENNPLMGLSPSTTFLSSGEVSSIAGAVRNFMPLG